ncbi:gamma-glutamyltransferase family protein [Leptolyngbya sp. O-77]|uniref:gamma-glutamyltransferase family protein n=1 Tax=Leptolyngbya sp. O-77 TaxID=1080068 RepID=UPI00074D38B4|nr:gamma-glutamyltransferase family protein [Leptolyngbya sp. O-77]BAU40911.1 Putative gamma-glutamyltransferase YwrD [Leptolyngbya sp. O-77]
MTLTDYPYPSGRRVIMGQRCAMATSQPLATMAGAEMIWAGGNAVDAALAMAIALTVVEPTSNGIGSDAFAMVWDGQLHGLNASGRSPQGLARAAFGDLATVPPCDWRAVTVPGAVSGWRSLWQRWGKLPFEQLFEPAIRYAEQGFPVSPETARAWQRAERVFLPLQGKEFEPFKRVFFAGDSRGDRFANRAPKAGEIWRSEGHARTLRAIAQSGGEAFYTGELAQKITRFAASTGGFLTMADLESHTADWVAPISTTYRDLTVWELPPNGQGIAALMALNILEGVDLGRYPRDSADSFHWQIEAIKLAFADAYRYVADPHSMEFDPAWLLDKGYAGDRRSLISDTALPLAKPGIPKGGTVFLVAAEPDLMVSFIQSNYEGFGSGILIPDTGIALHNRGAGLHAKTRTPQRLCPSKRPFHTIIPGFFDPQRTAARPLRRNGRTHAAPRAMYRWWVNLTDYGMNPQAALDAPRWRFLRDNLVLLEQAVPPSVVRALGDRHHAIQLSAEVSQFGKGQIILKQGSTLIAASEPRADGLAIAL